MLVYRSVTHFLCQKMQFWKKNMSSGMQSPTSSKLHQKKLSLLSLLMGLMDWSMEKNDEGIEMSSSNLAAFSRALSHPPTPYLWEIPAPPPKQTTPWTWNSVPSLENSWKMFVFRFQFHIKLQLCTFFTCFLKRYIDPKIEWWWN